MSQTVTPGNLARQAASEIGVKSSPGKFRTFLGADPGIGYQRPTVLHSEIAKAGNVDAAKSVIRKAMGK